MATVVLYPRDCVRHSLAPSSIPHSSSAFVYRRKPLAESHTHSHDNCNTSTNPTVNHHLFNGGHFNARVSPNPKPCRKAVAKKRNEVACQQPALFMGQVTILKRGELLGEKIGGFLSKQEERSGSGGVISSEVGGDLIVPGRKTRSAVPVMYAGSAFSVSPSPSSLPLPTFSKKDPRSSTAQVSASPSVDRPATEHLRRLLRLG